MGTNGDLLSNGTDKLSKLINGGGSVNKGLISVGNPYESSDESVANALLDKIRKRAKQSKTWNDLARLSKTFLYEKRHPIISDQQERSQLQRCLDTIQKSIKVTSLQSMIERLETITRQVGLKFIVSNQSDKPSFKSAFISCEFFYVEVVFDTNSGSVYDVRIAHSADPVSCPELTKVLRDADFVEFNKHLTGLIEIYKLNADKTKKNKAYLALSALEQDLNVLSKLQSSSIIEPNNLVHKSPVGILEPRKGGRPMKLTYFISPYDLLDEKRKVSLPLSIGIITEKNLGYSSTVCVENSSGHRLQTTSLISITKSPDGKNLPQFSALNSQNSVQLPACFALKLSESLPLSVEIMNKIKQAASGLDVIYEPNTTHQPLISLLTKRMLPKKELSKFKSVDDPFFVELPDQCHTYYFNSSVSNMLGVEATHISFQHPTSVPKILGFLRQQVLFNVLISSCIRQMFDRKELTFKSDNPPMMFEVTAPSMTSISVSFEHPVEESLATIDFDLDEITSIKAKLYDSQSFSTYCSDEHVSLVMQRCFSIPVTMRSVIKKCQDKVAAVKEELRKKQAQQMQVRQNDVHSAAGSEKNQSENVNAFYNQQMISNDERPTNRNNLMNNKFDNFQQQQPTNTPLSNNLQSMLQNQRPNYPPRTNLTQQQQYQQAKSNTMLMTMLSDVPAANSQTSALNSSNSYFTQQQQQQQQQPKNSGNPMNNSFNATLQSQQQPPKVKKQRKRKGQDANIKSPSAVGRSPKRKISEDELSYGSDLATPGSDYSYENYHSVGNSQPLSRPSSTASSNSAQFSSLKPEQDADSNSHLSGEGNNFNSFLDSSSSFDFKRKRSQDSSNASDDHDMGFKSSSYEDLHSQDNFALTKFSAITKTYSSASSKSPNSSGLMEKKNATLETLLKDAGGSAVAVPKKERKRKKTETDSNKSVALSSLMVSNIQLMPPPTSTTGGLIASSSASAGSAGFGDSDSSNSSLNSPALRQINLNVKSTSSMSAAASLNAGSMANIKAADKNFANKLKQGSPKVEDSFSMPNYSPKSSPKVPKASKQPKIINTPTNANLSIATSPKSQTKQQQQQSLKLKSLNTPGLTITKTTSITSPITISSPTSASPLSPKTQNPLLVAGKTVPTKKGKGSLSAVIDKLSVRVSATTTSNNDDNSLGSLSSNSASSKDGLQLTGEMPFVKNESNKDGGPGKPSTSPAGVSKLNEGKAKYAKPSDYTVKQSSVGGLKFTVTKTTKSPLLETKAKNSQTAKPSSIASKNSASSSLNSAAGSLFQQQQNKQSTNKTSTGIKRQLNAGVGGFKAGSQGSKSGTGKSVSPESCDQILEAAIPKIHLDKLPKIPKTLNSQQSVSQQTTGQPMTQPTSTPTVQQSQIKNSLQAKFLQQQQHLKQQTQNLLRQQLNYNNLNSGNQLHFRKYGNNQRTVDSLSQSGNQPQASGSDSARSNEQSFGGAVSSSVSISKSANGNDNQSQHQATLFAQPDGESQSKNEPNKASLNKGQINQGTNKSSANATAATAVSSTTVPPFSAAVNPSSTPSSPMECNVIPDVYQKSPPLIPTETIEEQQTPSSPTPATIVSGLTQFAKTKTVYDTSSSSDQQKKMSLESTIAKLSEKQHSIGSISSFILPPTSKLTTTAEVKKVFLDEDDEERLFIDEDVSKKSNSSTPSKTNETTKMDLSPAKSGMEKATSLPDGAPSAVAGSAPSSSAPSGTLSGAPSTNPATQSITIGASSINPASAVTNESPVSNNSSTNPKQSPFSIDDDLMDEALTG